MSWPLDELLALARDAAVAAGGLLATYQTRTLAVDTKSSDTDPVSEADEAAERLILEALLDARPDDGIVAEEQQGDRPGTSGLRWVVDPLDGTVNYLYGIPQWCVSVAAEDDDGGVVGVVHDPARDETFTAARGRGARLGDRRLEVTDRGALDRTLVATGFAYDPELRAAQGDMAADLLRRARDLRRGGAAAIDLAWTAAGRFDGYYEFGLNPWDWAAGRLLVREAGGVVTDLDRTVGGRSRAGLVAGGRAAHDHLLGWLEETA